MRRARHSHQKQERRETILAAALQALAEMPYQAITMSLVAERTGLVKGTLYLYFATKEELFLEVLRNQIHGWFWDLETGLEVLPRRGRPKAVARLIAGTTAARPAFRLLLGVLHSALEHNLPDAAALAFKREFAAQARSMGARLERILPFLAEGQGARLVLQVHALAIGMHALAEPPAQVRRLLGHADLEALRLEFATGFGQAVEALLIGIREERRRAGTPDAVSPS